MRSDSPVTEVDAAAIESRQLHVTAILADYDIADVTADRRYILKLPLSVSPRYTSLFAGPVSVPSHFIYNPARPLGLRWKRHFVPLTPNGRRGTHHFAPSTPELAGLKCIHAHVGCATVFLFCDKCAMCVKLATGTTPWCAPTVGTRTWSAAELRELFVPKVVKEQE